MKKKNRYKEIRNVLGYSLSQMADELNRSVSLIQKYEAGCSKPPDKVKLCYLALGYVNIKQKYDDLLTIVERIKNEK